MTDSELEKIRKTYWLDVHELEEEALRFKVKYINHVDDAIKTPFEVWFHPEINATFYFVRVEGDITVIVKVIDSVLIDYAVIQGDHEYINSMRRGILLYHQKSPD